MLSAQELLAHAESLTDSVQLVDRILRAGLLLHASDVHLDPAADSVRVRFRIDGALEEVLRIPAAMQNAVTSRLKVLASLDIAERRAPQDGGFSWRMGGAGAFAASPLDVRMATLPVRHGERVTLRLLETGGKRLGIAELGMSDSDRAAFEAVLRRPHGLVLLTGPTGSGKTTTLYAAIQELMKGEPLNIITVEDPIEYEIPGVAQAEVDSAALTGHLVLSTLHTNDAKSSVTRLVDMGLDPNLVPATLRLAVAQRLVRRLCPECRTKGTRGWEPKGCVACGGRGYWGRIGLFEMYAPETGLSTSIADDARAKVAAGITSEAEILRALGG